MKKFLLVIMCVLLLSPIFPAKVKAELGDWKLYFIILSEVEEQSLINFGQATARFSAEPGVADTIWTDWVQDGRQGEDPEDWLYSNWIYDGSTENLPVVEVAEGNVNDLWNKWNNMQTLLVGTLVSAVLSLVGVLVLLAR